MKRLVVFLTLVFLLVACNSKIKNGSNNAILNDDIKVEKYARIEAFSLKDAMERADLVAEVIIKEKIEEVSEGELPYTVFGAEVIETYQGKSISKVITIKQQGDSKVLVNNVELFEAGEKYVFFLKETIASKSDYWIIGEETGFFQVLDHETVVKLVHSIPEFEDIEIEPLTELNFSKTDLKLANEEQIINKKKFIDKIIHTD